MFIGSLYSDLVKAKEHFTSAMMQLGYDNGDEGAICLELAQFLTEKGSNTKSDLAELWRRIVFNIAVSNTDDHLRNYGFIYSKDGWLLSPAYDINPVTPASGLHLNINEVLESVVQWGSVAMRVGLARAEQ